MNYRQLPQIKLHAIMSIRSRLRQIALRSITNRERVYPTCHLFLYQRVLSKDKLPLLRYGTQPLSSITSRFITQNASLLSNESQLDLVKYEEIANTTLDLLAEFLESLSDDGICPEDFDVYLSSGVLTVNVGGGFGTYVINKQTPNRQIWLSSPTSGPKRYDYINGRWIYLHNGEDMNELLSKEFSIILQQEIDLSKLKYPLHA